MAVGAAIVSAAAVVFLGLGLAHLGRRGGRVERVDPLGHDGAVGGRAAGGPRPGRGGRRPRSAPPPRRPKCVTAPIGARRDHADVRRRVARRDLAGGGRRAPAQLRPASSIRAPCCTWPRCGRRRPNRCGARSPRAACPMQNGVRSAVRYRALGRRPDQPAARLLLRAGARALRLRHRAAAHRRRPVGAPHLGHPERPRCARRRDRLAADPSGARR